MSLDAIATARADAASSPDECFSKAFGQTLFYPFGPGWGGYIVPDGERERALRAALLRYRDNPTWWRTWPLFFLPLAFCAFMAVSGHPFLLLAAFTFPIVLTLICDRILLRYQFGALLRDLKTVGSRDKTPGYIRQIFAAAVALASITLVSYDQRVAALPVAEGTTAYYTDIAQPLIVALICGFLALATISVRSKLEAQFSANKILLAVVLFTSLALFGTALATLEFFYPTPELVIAPDELQCARHVRWADVTDLGQAASVRGAQYAWLSIDSKRPGESGGTARCEISGLNEDYQTVYHAIRTAWLATRRPAFADATTVDRIAIGATRQQAAATLGLPAVLARTPDGSIALYYADPGAADANAGPAEKTGRRVTALYFDTGGRVERVALFGVREGKIFDAVSQRNLTGGVEYPLLESIFFDKARRG